MALGTKDVGTHKLETVCDTQAYRQLEVLTALASTCTIMCTMECVHFRTCADIQQHMYLNIMTKKPILKISTHQIWSSVL